MHMLRARAPVRGLETRRRWAQVGTWEHPASDAGLAAQVRAKAEAVA